MSLLWIVRSHQLVLLLVLQVITSLFFIYKGKNKLSYTTEIILMIIFMYYNRFDFSIKQLICYFTEYILMKMLLLIIVFVAKEFAFYVIVSVTNKNSGGYKLFKNKKKFIKFEAHIWNKIKYGIRLKKGIPAMVNKKHKLTGVSFDKDGFPKFKAVVTVNLDRKLWKKERDIHFYHASRILYEKISKNKKLADKFNKKEIELFRKGRVPSKYTWHHHQDKGKLILVDSEIHSNVNHHGGFSIWGKR